MVKAKLYRQNHTQMHTHRHSQKEEKEKYIYIYRCSQSPPPQFGMIRCLFRCHRCRVHQVDCRVLIRGSALDLAPPLHVDHLRAFVLRSDRMGLKEQLIRQLWLTQSGGWGGYGCGASLWQQRPAWRCISLRRAVHSCGEVVHGSRDPGIGGLHRLPGGEVWIVTCACTQVSWWLQPQP